MLQEQYRKMKWKIDKTFITDSKKMTKMGRELWFKKLKSLENEKKIFCKLSFKSAKEIDKRGISITIKDCITKNLKKLIRQLAKKK